MTSRKFTALIFDQLRREVAEHLAVSAVSHPLVDTPLDRFREIVYRSVGKDELTRTGVP